ncbi:MAG: hypothetical protein GEV28_05320 [Actinophytocola sp.]|uniref:hypothetical protein n=1 Tax=Actinophytocola sp. TaxID=1872138 RepID=UPI00132BCC44|nr:hypothetical protein [Actinophytocola sp.]MPZ79836.1 hypothetical protein [Actinophytocola sp.]
MHGSWVRGPVGLDAGARITRAGFRTVLVMVPSVTAGTRLLDLLPLVEVDHRVQAVFTVPNTGETWHGVEEFTRRTGGIVVPWAQAMRHRWDLVLTASHRHIEQVHGPVLVLPHGAGSVGSLRRSRKASGATRDTTGLDRDLLTFRGRLVPAALALSHELELAVLRRTCPEAEPVAVVTGDPCLDRMSASIGFRDHYRSALGIADGQELVTISSTWGTESTFGRHPELYQQILTEADDRTRVAAVLHPMVHAAHGSRQVHTWLAAARDRGLIVVPPDEGWRAVMIASDRVLGDHGSTTSYAAAIGRPVHLAAFPARTVRPTSIAATLARTAPRLDHDRPVLPQLADAKPVPSLAGMITSRPGSAAAILRRTMYRLLDLDEPSWPAPNAVLPLPRPATCPGDRHV